MVLLLFFAVFFENSSDEICYFKFKYEVFLGFLMTISFVIFSKPNSFLTMTLEINGLKKILIMTLEEFVVILAFSMIPSRQQEIVETLLEESCV